MVRFKMVGRDVNSIPTQYRTWVVENTPDLTGALYTGPKSGPNPMVDISAYAIFDDNAVVDFNLPVPTLWQSIPDTPFDFYGRRVLPDQVSDGSLAVIDGYIYIFGGKVTNKIYMSTVNDPGTWVDTGATLPTVLYNSSLAIVGDTIYLFGGNTGDATNSQQPVDTIFSAPVSNPLQWTNNGSLLPRAIHSSSLGMANGYLFLAGGQETNTATNLIFTASTSDPLTWTIASGTLPTPLYGSTIIQSQGFWYLLGGQIFPDEVVSTIFRAPVTAPFIWQSYGELPYASSYGAFFPMGEDGYYIGPASNDGYDTSTFTPILQAPLASLTQWIDTRQVVPAVLSHSQTAIIVDRFWFFAGSGLTAIFTNAQVLKYPIYYPTVVAYGAITRTLFQSSDNLDNPFLVLGIPYWLTDYQM
jgi:hypothetical protein